ncbi:MAG: hypothetical protein KBS52_07005 [Clostridiales bacterium]|nr:hypothetical protein [Candidatus Equinaster intestinalis]
MKKFLMLILCLTFFCAVIPFSANAETADLSITTDLEITEDTVCENLILAENCTLTLKEKSSLIVNGSAKIKGTVKIESGSELTVKIDAELYGNVNVAENSHLKINGELEIRERKAKLNLQNGSSAYVHCFAAAENLEVPAGATLQVDEILADKLIIAGKFTGKTDSEFKVMHSITISPGGVFDYTCGESEMKKITDLLRDYQVVIKRDSEGYYNFYSHSHNFENGFCTACNGNYCELNHKDHEFFGNVCRNCGVKGCEIGVLEHQYENGVCTVCSYECQNTFHSGKCPECGMTINASSTASVLSHGNLAIITAVGGVAIGFMLSMFIFKKKKTYKK